MQRDQIATSNNQNVDIVLFNDHNERIRLLNEDIDKIMAKKTETAMMKCKAMWYKYSEKSSLSRARET